MRCAIIFEDLPSDDNSISSVDNSDDDETYSSELSKPNSTQSVVVESPSTSEDKDENVEIFKIDENKLFILSSSKKTC